MIKVESSQKIKRKDLEQLVRERQQELRKERERIRLEFDASIDELYNKAVKLHKSGSFSSAKSILEEIEKMKPEHKDTKKLLVKIEKSMNKSAKGAAKPEKKEPQEMQPLNTRKHIISDVLDSFEESLTN